MYMDTQEIHFLIFFMPFEIFEFIQNGSFSLKHFFFRQSQKLIIAFVKLWSAGVITRYEVFLRGPMELRNLSSPAEETRVFLSSGWLDPSVPPEAQLSNSSTVPPPESRAIVTGLMAFSTYEMRVVSINTAGSATSVWATARTMEGGPCSQNKSIHSDHIKRYCCRYI